ALVHAHAIPKDVAVIESVEPVKHVKPEKKIETEKPKLISRLPTQQKIDTSLNNPKVKGLTVKTSAMIKSTGTKVLAKENAHEALMRTNEEIEALYSILEDCL
nr:hypothetical protein [Colwellia sp.]